MPYFGHKTTRGILSRLIRFYVGLQVQADHNRLENMHKSFWRSQRPQDWFDATSDRLNRVYIPIFESLVESLDTHLRINRIASIVEFGTGNGDWLAWLKTKWDSPTSFLGIDLAEQQIAANRQRHADLDFKAGDMTEWVISNQSRRTLFVTHCGVLEYLSEATLRQFLSALQANHRESMVFFVEPHAECFDFQDEQHSRLLGSEFSFSHNYPRLLEQADFEVIHTSQHTVEGYRMLSTLAKSSI